MKNTLRKFAMFKLRGFRVNVGLENCTQMALVGFLGGRGGV